MFGIFALLVLCAAVFAQNGTTDADREFLQSRYSFVYANAQKEMVAMDATITYLSSQGVGTAQLSQYREEFESKLGQLKDSADAGDRTRFEAVNAEMHQLASQFRDQVGATNASGDALRERIRLALQERNGTLANASNAAWANAQNGAMTSFDAHYANAERIRNQMGEKGYNVSGMDPLLAQITAKRAQLQSAYQSQDREQVRALQAEIDGLYRQLKDEGVNRYTERLGKLFGAAQQYMGTIGQMGGNTTGLNNTYGQMQQNLAQLQRACTSGTAQECRQTAQQLRSEFMNFRDEAKGEMNAARERNENKGAGSAGGKENETNQFGNGTGANGTGNGTGPVGGAGNATNATQGGGKP
jgi:hypothetical protein